MRRGLRETLAETGDIEVVGEAGDYGELRQLPRNTGCDVMLLDVNLPGRSGIDVLHVMVDEGTTIRIAGARPTRRTRSGIRARRQVRWPT